MNANVLSATGAAEVGITHYCQIPPELRNRIAKVAAHTLIRDGYIRLGEFCAALQRETRRKKKYGSMLAFCVPYFSRLSAEGMWSLYERILFQLERDHGPLLCTDRGWAQQAAWGFADPVCDSCGAHATKPADAILCRNLVLIPEHPDWRYMKAGKLPNTVWTKFRVRTAQAA